MGALDALRATLSARETELARKTAMLVQLGTQLRAQSERADAAEDRVEALSAQERAPRADAGADADAVRAQLDEQRALALASAREAVEARAQRDETERALGELRAAYDAAQAELGALSPEFFDEVEELKYKFAQGAAQLARYERLYGRLPPEPRSD